MPCVARTSMMVVLSPLAAAHTTFMYSSTNSCARVRVRVLKSAREGGGSGPARLKPTSPYSRVAPKSSRLIKSRLGSYRKLPQLGSVCMNRHSKSSRMVSRSIRRATRLRVSWDIWDTTSMGTPSICEGAVSAGRAGRAGAAAPHHLRGDHAAGREIGHGARHGEAGVVRHQAAVALGAPCLALVVALERELLLGHANDLVHIETRRQQVGVGHLEGKGVTPAASGVPRGAAAHPPVASSSSSPS